MSTRTSQAGIFSRRMLAIAAVAAIALSLALTMRVALANDLHQADDTPISWDDPNFQGTADECKDANLDPGEVLWHFVHTMTDGGDLASQLDAEFDSDGPRTAAGYSNGNGSAQVMYDIITGEDSLLSASDDIENTADGGLLNLSHICFGGEEESVPESAEQSVEGSVEESVPGSVEESVPESAEQSVEGSTEQSVGESEEASGEQSVEAGTGTPEESTPDGSFFGAGSSALPTIAFSLILLASLGTLAYANVKTIRNRI